MKEKFRDKIPTGKMKCKYWIDKKAGVFSHWETHAEILIDHITTVVDYYKEIDIRLTNRQLYYQLVGKNLIPNAHEVYKRICVFLTDMRYNGLVDWRAIEDKARVPSRPPQWDDIQTFIKSVTAQYRLPRWDDQEYYVEMYCEKEAGINVLSTISRKYQMYFGFNKGYSSAAAMYELAERIGEQISNSKSVKILYFGDHDPSGLDMIRDIEDRIYEFLTAGEYPVNPTFEVIPVSLTMDQIEIYGPPPNPAKITDPRAGDYIKQHGNVSWELDAIDALELRRMAETAVLDYLDVDLFNEWIATEEVEKKILVEFGKTLE